MSSVRRRSDSSSVRSSSSRRRRCMTFCASAWLLQKSGAAMRGSTSASCSSRCAPSKMPPQFHRPLAQVLVTPNEIINGNCHDTLLQAGLKTRLCETHQDVEADLPTSQGRTTEPWRRRSGPPDNNERDGDERHRHVRHDVANLRVDRPDRQKPDLLDQRRLFKDSRLLHDAPVRDRRRR